jgi:hypothetical protein
MSIIRLVKKFTAFTEHKGSSLCSSQSITGPILNLQEIHPGHALTDPPHTFFYVLFFPLSEVQIFTILVTVIF